MAFLEATRKHVCCQIQQTESHAYTRHTSRYIRLMRKRASLSLKISVILTRANAASASSHCRVRGKCFQTTEKDRMYSTGNFSRQHTNQY